MKFLNNKDKIRKEFSKIPQWQKNILSIYAPNVSFNLKELSEDNNLPNWVIKECKKNSKVWRDEKENNNVINIDFNNPAAFQKTKKQTKEDL